MINPNLSVSLDFFEDLHKDSHGGISSMPISYVTFQNLPVLVRGWTRGYLRKSDCPERPERVGRLSGMDRQNGEHS